MGEPNAQVACKSDQNSVHPSARPYVCTSTQNVVFNPAYFLTTGTIGPAAPNACRHLQSSPWSQLRPSSIAKLPHHTSSWGIDHKQMQSRKCLPTPPTQKRSVLERILEKWIYLYFEHLFLPCRASNFAGVATSVVSLMVPVAGHVKDWVPIWTGY